MSYSDDPAPPPATSVPEPVTDADASAAPPAETAPSRKSAGNMLPARGRRSLGFERLIVRLIATAGIVGIGVGIAAILASSKVQGWIIGLVVAALSVFLSALLWSSRQL